MSQSALNVTENSLSPHAAKLIHDLKVTIVEQRKELRRLSDKVAGADTLRQQRADARVLKLEEQVRRLTSQREGQYQAIKQEIVKETIDKLFVLPEHRMKAREAMEIPRSRLETQLFQTNQKLTEALETISRLWALPLPPYARNSFSFPRWIWAKIRPKDATPPSHQLYED